jgi:hypothetical protein
MTTESTVKKPRVGPDTLNDIYVKWQNNCGLNLRVSYWNDIHRVSLKYGVGKDFDDYVWGSGGRIYQEHGKRYAEFFEDTDLTMFLLKWS